jgi:hypothetical protein
MEGPHIKESSILACPSPCHLVAMFLRLFLKVRPQPAPGRGKVSYLCPHLLIMLMQLKCNPFSAVEAEMTVSPDQE